MPGPTLSQCLGYAPAEDVLLWYLAKPDTDISFWSSRARWNFFHDEVCPSVPDGKRICDSLPAVRSCLSRFLKERIGDVLARCPKILKRGDTLRYPISLGVEMADFSVDNPV